jgi:hypothetical protein
MGGKDIPPPNILAAILLWQLMVNNLLTMNRQQF